MNNVIIPELTIDKNGRYPLDESVAKQRLYERNQYLESLLRERYVIPNTFSYQTVRLLSFIGGTIVSPITIPIMYISEKQRLKSNEIVEKKISLFAATKNYFKNLLTNPKLTETNLKNKYIIVTIP